MGSPQPAHSILRRLDRTVSAGLKKLGAIPGLSLTNDKNPWAEDSSCRMKSRFFASAVSAREAALYPCWMRLIWS